ncbi:FHA domain-containing protein [Leifsonia sp. 2TAF2]|uniref:FHA domain-containing protein n=1 Tax=Leifsonia sp. 2TAF2 TaxID=3233009 RepID=UPI003F958F32
MDDSGFIVPPPGLIPSKPAAGSPVQGEAVAAVRPLPAFTPPTPAAPAAPVRPLWRLILPAGRSVPITRDVLLGRNPSRAAHPESTTHTSDPELIALDDPTSTVSKTHALLSPDGDALTVTDLHSTNGVLVGGTRAEPGAPTPVPDGADLLLGDLAVRVQRS